MDVLGLLGRPDLRPAQVVSPVHASPAAYLSITWSDDIKTKVGPFDETWADWVLVFLFTNVEWWKGRPARPVRAQKVIDGWIAGEGGIVQ